jgi:lactam utilization protein B
LDDATMVMHSCNNLAEGFHAACMQFMQRRSMQVAAA